MEAKVLLCDFCKSSIKLGSEMYEFRIFVLAGRAPIFQEKTRGQETEQKVEIQTE